MDCFALLHATYLLAVESRCYTFLYDLSLLTLSTACFVIAKGRPARNQFFLRKGKRNFLGVIQRQNKSKQNTRSSLLGQKIKLSHKNT